jgi:xylulokinase
VCVVVTEPALDPGGVTEPHPHATPGGWLLENPGWLSGGAYRWFADELGAVERSRAAATGSDVYELLNEMAAGVPPGADGVVWIPALAGALAPEWNPDARAAWFGLTAAHGRSHLARALLEGNAFALRDVVSAMSSTGLEPTELVCVGGGARGDLLLQIRADVTGLAATRPHDVETTARGAAMLAAAGGGLHADVPTAVAQMAGSRREPILPDPERSAVYAGAHERYRRLYEAVRPLF